MHSKIQSTANKPHDQRTPTTYSQAITDRSAVVRPHLCAGVLYTVNSIKVDQVGRYAEMPRVECGVVQWYSILIALHKEAICSC